MTRRKSASVTWTGSDDAEWRVWRSQGTDSVFRFATECSFTFSLVTKWQVKPVTKFAKSCHTFINTIFEVLQVAVIYYLSLIYQDANSWKITTDLNLQAFIHYLDYSSWNRNVLTVGSENEFPGRKGKPSIVVKSLNLFWTKCLHEFYFPQCLQRLLGRCYANTPLANFAEILNRK